MKTKQRSLLAFSTYGIGVALATFVLLIAVWADVESGSYNFPRLANAGLDGLHCPILMTPDETGTIWLHVANPTKNEISPSVRAQMSTSLSPQEFLENIQLTPGESKKLEWSVDAENIDMGYFIFAKVLLFSAYPLPSQEATCGIFILDLPGTGKIILPVLIVLSLITIGWGLYSINKFSISDKGLKKYTSLMAFLALTIGLGLVFSLTGGWISSLLMLVVSLLLMVILGSSLAMGKAA